MPPKAARAVVVNSQLPATTVERLFRDAVVDASVAAAPRAVAAHNVDVDDDAAAGSAATAVMGLSRDARVAANRAANVAVLMMATLAADARLMEAPPIVARRAGVAGRTGAANGASSAATSSALAGTVTTSNVLAALGRAGFPHLVARCRAAILEGDADEVVVTGTRREREEH